MTTKNEKDILKIIRNGEYRDCYLIYNRKSGKDADNQKNSIEYQKQENAKFAQGQKLRIAQVTLEGFCQSGMVSERHSGFAEDTQLDFTKDGKVQFNIERPKFQTLVHFLNQGYFKGVVCLCWDRFSRNSGDNTIIKKLTRAGIDIRFAFANYDDTSSGQLHQDIDGMFAMHHSRVTSEKVRTATRALRKRGVCTYRAAIGYLNTGDIYNRPFDPERADKVFRLFELCAEGDWSLTDLEGWAREYNLTTPPMRKRRSKAELLSEEEVDHPKISRPLSRSTIFHILRNRFYTGRILDVDGVWIKSKSHKALVTDELFNRVQDVLSGKKVSKRYTRKLDQPYRGKMRCTDCGRMYSPYIKKGIQYYRSRCKTNCPNPRKNMSRDFLEKAIAGVIETIPFSQEALKEVIRKADTDRSIIEREQQQFKQQNEARKKKLRGDLDYLDKNRLTLLQSGVYSPEAYAAEVNRLQSELAVIDTEKQLTEEKIQELTKTASTFTELLDTAKNQYIFANSAQKEKFVEILFTELSYSENTLNYKLRNGFQVLNSLFVQSSAQSTTRFEPEQLKALEGSMAQLEKWMHEQ